MTIILSIELFSKTSHDLSENFLSFKYNLRLYLIKILKDNLSHFRVINNKNSFSRKVKICKRWYQLRRFFKIL